MGRAGSSRGLSPGRVDCHLLPVSSQGRPSVCVCILICSSYKDPSPMGSGSTLVTSFYLHPLLKRPQFQIQPHSEVLGVWTSPYEFRGNTVQSMTGDQGIAHIFPSAKLPVCVGNLGLYRHTEVSTFYFCLHQRMQPFPLKIITGA